jgi:putative ABC transport system permease protein
MSPIQLFDNLASDVRYALRTFRRSPLFAGGAILTLAVGIGASVAVFAFVNGLLLRPLPYSDPNRLVAVEDLLSNYPGGGIPVSYLNFLDWQRRQHVFTDIAIYDQVNLVLTGSGEAERAFGARVSAALFRALAVLPARGRTFTEEEDRLGGPPVAIISHGLWQRRFAGQDVVGHVLVVDDVPRTIVGIMPAGFGFPDETALWIPAAVDPTEYPRDRHSFPCLARLKPGLTLEDAGREMRAIAAQLAREYPGDNEGLSVTLRPLRGNLVPGQAGLGFLLLMGAVTFVLLIACANLANLMLGRAAARGPEMAMRSALGASRERLVRQSLTESGLLAGSGAALGLPVATIGRDLLVALVPADMPSWLGFEIDWTVAAFALLLAGLATMLVGLVPALRASKPALAPVLSACGARVTRSRDWLRQAMIMSEVALATMLLVGSGLMMRALTVVLAVDPGLRTANVWSGRVTLPPARYPSPDRQRAFYTEVLEQVRSLPGVRRASAVSSLPMGGSATSRGVTIEGRAPVAPNEELLALLCIAMPDYFETTGIRLLRGRTFTDRDGPDTLPVAIVNETFVKRFLPPGDPIGRRVTLGDGAEDDPWLTIVGVTADVRHMGLAAEAEAGLFIPYSQKPVPSMSLVARADSSPLSLTEPIRRTILRIDRDRPLFAVRTLEQVMAQSIWQSRLFTWLFAVFGAVALTLACIGVYSVISYTVTQRSREIGVRLALGAGRRQIYRLVMWHGIGPAGAGLAIGLAGSTVVGRVLRSWLQGVSITDPATYTIVALVLLSAAFAACLLPSRRAARIDPMAMLRGQ